MIFTGSRRALLEHITQLKSIVVLKSKNDKANAAHLEADLAKYAERHTLLSRFRIVVFVFLYASVVSAVSAGLPIVQDVVTTISALGGLVGVGVLSLLALYLTYRMNTLWDNMIIVYSHLIAIYEKNNTAIYGVEHMPNDKQ